MNVRKQLLKLTLAASLAAVSIVIDVFFKQVLSISNFGLPFHAIPTVIGSIILGPFYGVLIALVADVMGVVISGFTFFPLFAVGAFFWGLVPGVFLHKKYSVLKLAFVLPLTYVMVSSANTYALVYYFGAETTLSWLFLRVAVIPFNSVIMVYLIKDVYLKLAPFHEQFDLKPQISSINF